MYLGCQTIRTRDKIYLISELWGSEMLLEILKSDSPYFSGVSPFTGLDYWTGILDWTTGLESLPF